MSSASPNAAQAGWSASPGRDHKRGRNRRRGDNPRARVVTERHACDDGRRIGQQRQQNAGNRQGNRFERCPDNVAPLRKGVAHAVQKGPATARNSRSAGRRQAGIKRKFQPAIAIALERCIACVVAIAGKCRAVRNASWPWECLFEALVHDGLLYALRKTRYSRSRFKVCTSRLEQCVCKLMTTNMEYSRYCACLVRTTAGGRRTCAITT